MIIITFDHYAQSFLKWLNIFKCFDSNKTIPFKVSDNKLLKKYTKMWERVSSLMNIEFDSEPVPDDNNKYKKQK